MLYSCTRMAAVGFKGLKSINTLPWTLRTAFLWTGSRRSHSLLVVFLHQFFGRLFRVDHNKAGQNVRLSVCPQKVFLIWMQIGVLVGDNEFYMTVCHMTWSKVTVTAGPKVAKISNSKSVSTVSMHAIKSLTVNYDTPIQYLNVCGTVFFDIFCHQASCDIQS